MSEMVERVALAIARELHGKPSHEEAVDLADVARAAIKAMREPAEPMLDRRLNTWATFPERLIEDWQKMIDAALKEPDRPR